MVVVLVVVVVVVLVSTYSMLFPTFINEWNNLILLLQLLFFIFKLPHFLEFLPRDAL